MGKTNCMLTLLVILKSKRLPTLKIEQWDGHGWVHYTMMNIALRVPSHERDLSNWSPLFYPKWINIAHNPNS